MPTRTKAKAKKPAAKRAAKTTERATEAQLDKLSAQVVKLRDVKGQSWADICDALDIQPSRARQLYNRGGGEPNATKATAKKGSAKTAAKRRGKKNPS